MFSAYLNVVWGVRKLTEGVIKGIVVLEAADILVAYLVAPK